MDKVDRILDYLDELFPKAYCELEYSKDYELLIAIVLSAQTTDKKVNKVTRVLFKQYSSIRDLANARVEDIENIIREIGTYKKKSVFVYEIANRLVKDYDGIVPKDAEYLITLPGVGRKTINVFLAEFYGVPAIAVDTHVERVSKRLKLAYKNDDVVVVEKKLMKKIPKERWIKTHHQFIFFGRYFCKAQNPNCKQCKLVDICRYSKSKETNKLKN